MYSTEWIKAIKHIALKRFTCLLCAVKRFHCKATVIQHISNKAIQCLKAMHCILNVIHSITLVPFRKLSYPILSYPLT